MKPEAKIPTKTEVLMTVLRQRHKVCVNTWERHYLKINNSKTYKQQNRGTQIFVHHFM